MALYGYPLPLLTLNLFFFVLDARLPSLSPSVYNWSPRIIKVDPNSCLEWFAPAAGLKGFIDVSLSLVLLGSVCTFLPFPLPFPLSFLCPYPFPSLHIHQQTPSKQLLEKKY